MKKIILVWVLFAVTGFLWAAGAQEGGGSNRVEYLAERDFVAPPDEIRIESYIAAEDYHYPLPKDAPFSLNLYTGNEQLSIGGQNELIQIGLQGARVPFEELPPLNLAFVIDHSGSMAAADKMDWVKESFEIFIQKVREIDYVSLVIFDDEVEVVFPATRMRSDAVRTRFREAVGSIDADGSTNLKDGLTMGCLEVMKNFNRSYTNRVVFLSDGEDTVGNSFAEIVDVARVFSSEGVSISTIGLGESFDMDLMIEVAKVGEGSSRFISDREAMEETFGDELDRLVVSQAKDIEMHLEFTANGEIQDTWGYDYRQEGNDLYFSLPTLHHGDYETILVDFELYQQEALGELQLAEFELSYENTQGERVNMGPYPIISEIVEDSFPVEGYSNARVLQAGTMLHFARGLKDIGIIYDDLNRVHGNDANRIERYGYQLHYYWDWWGAPSRPVGRIEEFAYSRLGEALKLTRELKSLILNSQLRLGKDVFSEKIAILDNYIRIISFDMEMASYESDEAYREPPLAPADPDRSVQKNIDNLIMEILLGMENKQSATVAFCEFAVNGEEAQSAWRQFSPRFYASLTGSSSIVPVPAAIVDRSMETASLEPSDLTDIETAVNFGADLQVDYIMTGNIIETADAYIVFSRLISIVDGELDSSAQVVIAK